MSNPDIPSASVIAVFNHFDANGDGLISEAELKSVFQSINPEFFTDETVVELLQQADKDNDGSINYTEFLQWVMGEGEAIFHDVRTSILGSIGTISVSNVAGDVLLGPENGPIMVSTLLRLLVERGIMERNDDQEDILLLGEIQLGPYDFVGGETDAPPATLTWVRRSYESLAAKYDALKSAFFATVRAMELENVGWDEDAKQELAARYKEWRKSWDVLDKFKELDVLNEKLDEELRFLRVVSESPKDSHLVEKAQADVESLQSRIDDAEQCIGEIAVEHAPDGRKRVSGAWHKYPVMEITNAQRKLKELGISL